MVRRRGPTQMGCSLAPGPLSKLNQLVAPHPRHQCRGPTWQRARMPCMARETAGADCTRLSPWPVSQSLRGEGIGGRTRRL